MNKVYPIGYSVPGAQERINELLGNPKALLIDTRIKPTSWNEDWRKEALEQKYGERYKWAGKYLGNSALGTGRIAIAEPQIGIPGLINYLREQQDLILLCQCKAFDTCHMSVICTMLREKMPELEVVPYEPSLGPCADCGEPAIYRSPSGRPEGLGCEEHGRCMRCKRSLDDFVPLSYNKTCYVCPCVAATSEQIWLQQEAKHVKQATLF